MESPERGTPQSTFEHMIRSLANRPDVIHTQPTTLQTMTPVLELPQTWIVRTYRDEDKGDYVSLQYVSGEGTMQLVLPPRVCVVIARQHEALSTKLRRRSAKARAARDKAAGVLPGFLKNPGKKGKK